MHGYDLDEDDAATDRIKCVTPASSKAILTLIINTQQLGWALCTGRVQWRHFSSQISFSLKALNCYISFDGHTPLDLVGHGENFVIANEIANYYSRSILSKPKCT